MDEEIAFNCCMKELYSATAATALGGGVNGKRLRDNRDGKNGGTSLLFDDCLRLFFRIAGTLSSPLLFVYCPLISLSFCRRSALLRDRFRIY